MDKNDYRIEKLSETFSKHADIAEADNQSSIKNYRESFPRSDIPEWMENPFNISRALSVMAAEIESLKTFVIKNKI